MPPAFVRVLSRELAGLPAGAWVLAVGEGDGRHVAELARTFPHLRFAAFDIDADAVDRMASRKLEYGLTNLHVLLADAGRIPIRTKAVEAAYARSVLPWLRDPNAHVREIARTTRTLVFYRDVLNGPFYVLHRRLQSAALRLRGRRGEAEAMLRTARLSASQATTGQHGLAIARWLRGTKLFSRVELVGTDLLFWDLDRPLPLVGLIGAKISIRCRVAGPED